MAISRRGSSVQASSFATKMASSTRGWTDQATAALLEALKTRESLWNTKCKSYKNRNTKKKHYDESLHDCGKNVDLHVIPRLQLLKIPLSDWRLPGEPRSKEMNFASAIARRTMLINFL